VDRTPSGQVEAHNRQEPLQLEPEPGVPVREPEVAVQTVAVWGQAPRVGRCLSQRAEPSAPEVPSPAQERVRRGRRARQLIGCRRFWMSQLEHRAITG